MVVTVGVRRRGDAQDGDVGVQEHPLCGAAHQQLSHGGAVSQADDDQLGVGIVGSRQDLLGRLPVCDDLVDAMTDAVIGRRCCSAASASATTKAGST